MSTLSANLIDRAATFVSHNASTFMIIFLVPLALVVGYTYHAHLTPAPNIVKHIAPSYHLPIMDKDIIELHQMLESGQALLFRMAVRRILRLNSNSEPPLPTLAGDRLVILLPPHPKTELMEMTDLVILPRQIEAAREMGRLGGHERAMMLSEVMALSRFAVAREVGTVLGEMVVERGGIIRAQVNLSRHHNTARVGNLVVDSNVDFILVLPGAPNLVVFKHARGRVLGVVEMVGLLNQ